MAVSVMRLLALGLLAIALIMHVIGFATNGWITANMDKNDLQQFMKNNKGQAWPGQSPPMLSDKVELKIEMGLWQFCMHINLGLPQNIPGVPGVIDMCQRPKSADIPGWMRGVQALGILSMIVGVMALVILVYSFLGVSKGDRARLLPYIIGGVSLLAGLLLLIGVIMYVVEYKKMMSHQMAQLKGLETEMASIYAMMMKYVNLGYSFALEVVAAVLLLLVTLVVTVPVLKGGFEGSPHNMAV